MTLKERPLPLGGGEAALRMDLQEVSLARA